MLEQEEKFIAAEESETRAAQGRGIRRNLYEHINIAPKTLDRFIIVCALAILALVFFGAVTGDGPSEPPADDAAIFQQSQVGPGPNAEEPPANPGLLGRVQFDGRNS